MSESTINIITEPSVRLVGRQVIDDDALAEFLSDEGVESWMTDTDHAAQKLVEVGGRLCYKSYAKPRPGGNSAYLKHILEVGHGSVIEHAVYNFIITGVSRAFTHELVRHRAGWAYSQRSQRFCDESSASFVMPPLISSFGPEDGWIRTKWTRIISKIQEEYAGLSDDLNDLVTIRDYRAAGSPPRAKFANYHEYEEIDEALDWAATTPTEDRTRRRKEAREAARSVLPNATETQIFVTVNARAARHFVEARGDAHADAEIRAVAIAMLKLLQADSPNLFGDYAITDNPSGGQVAQTEYRKV